MTKGSSNKAFDQNAINMIVGKDKKDVPTQQSDANGNVGQAIKRTSLEINKDLYLEFKRAYLFKYDIPFRTFVENAMREALKKEKEE